MSETGESSEADKKGNGGKKSKKDQKRKKSKKSKKKKKSKKSKKERKGKMAPPPPPPEEEEEDTEEGTEGGQHMNGEEASMRWAREHSDELNAALLGNEGGNKVDTRRKDGCIQRFNKETGRMGKHTTIPFEEARAIVRALKLTTLAGFKKWRPQRPPGMPYHPSDVYRDTGWVSWQDWLGVANASQGVGGGRGGGWGWDLPFAEARAIVRELKLKSKKGWAEWLKKRQRPPGMPSAPDRTYRGKGFVDWFDWLGYEPRGLAPRNGARDFGQTSCAVCKLAGGKCAFGTTTTAKSGSRRCPCAGYTNAQASRRLPRRHMHWASMDGSSSGSSGSSGRGGGNGGSGGGTVYTCVRVHCIRRGEPGHLPVTATETATKTAGAVGGGGGRGGSDEDEDEDEEEEEEEEEEDENLSWAREHMKELNAALPSGVSSSGDSNACAMQQKESKKRKKTTKKTTTTKKTKLIAKI